MEQDFVHFFVEAIQRRMYKGREAMGILSFGHRKDLLTEQR